MAMKNIFSIHRYLPLLAAILILLNSCLKDNEFKLESTVPGTLAFLDIVDAKALVIADFEGQALVKPGSGTSLYKITLNGDFEKLRFFKVDTLVTQTQEGIFIELDSIELTDMVFPLQVIQLTNEYLALTLAQENPDNPTVRFEYNFLVNKFNGSVSNLPGYTPVIQDFDPNYDTMFDNEESTVQYDNLGNIYYLGDWAIHKLNILDQRNIEVGFLNPINQPGQGATNFRVNGSGDIILTIGGISTDGEIRYFFNNTLSDPGIDFRPYWKGFDDHFYFSSLSVNNSPLVEKIVIDNGQTTYETIGEFNDPQLQFASFFNGNIFRLSELNKIIIIVKPSELSGTSDNGDIITEVYNPAQNMLSFNLSELGMNSIKMGVNSPDYYYLAGMIDNQPALLKVDPSVFPHTATNLIPNGELDIIDMSISDDNILLFHAVQLSSGNTIVGEISAGGIVTEHKVTGPGVFHILQID
jgi:hypothetical protein